MDEASAAIVATQTSTFDELGRLLKTIGAASQTTTLSYDKTDNLKTVTDPRGKVFSYGYDSVNRLINETDPNNAQVNYTRDLRGVDTTYADPRSLQTTYVYNGFREVIQQVSPDSGTTIYVRDLRGLVTQITDGRGIVTNQTYDAAGRIKTKAYPAAVAENITYTYDATSATNWGKGRLTKLQSQNVIIDLAYDQRGNIKSDKRTIATKVHTTTYEYDLADRLFKINYPSGRIVTYYRDTTGRINQVTTKQNATAASVTLTNAIAYHPMSTLVKSQTFGNGLNDWNTYTTNEELDVLGLYNGAVSIINRAHTRTDNQNLTNIFDTVAPANNMSFWMENANRLQNANGPWGQKTFYYDGVGNRTTEITTAAGITTTDTLGYPATSNKIANMTRAAATLRTFVHDAGGNITSDTRSGTAYAYTYNKRNRLNTVTVAGSLKGTYTYNAREQLAIRVTSNMTPSGTTHFIHDLNGNVIAETAGNGPTGATGTVREYIYLPETEIAPAADGRTRVDRPLAVVNAVNTATPATYYVHVDHLNRPVMMTDSTKAQVWAAVWQAWGGSYAITGPQANDMRFPGQWFQLESGLHYNWHRHYDPSIGRYTQPDPLGFVDGPSVYGYVGGLPQSAVDPTGEFIPIRYVGGALVGGGLDLGWQLYNNGSNLQCVDWWEVAKGAAAGAGVYPTGRFAWLGKELRFGQNVRIAPFGNRTGHAYGKYPHYHRRGPPMKNGQTQTGQGIGRHRPWETKTGDTSWWRRF